MSGQDRVQTRGIRIVVLVVVVVVVAGWCGGGRVWEQENGGGEKGKGRKESHDSDSDDGGGSFREITGFSGVRLTGASTGQRVRDARWCWLIGKRREG